jgi:hypothetical protein
MKQKTPITAGTVIGAVNRTAEAARVVNSIIRLQAALLKENRNDLSQLSD